ncbi:aldolase/citrate lyase family protein [Clostridium sp. AM58-1XD]|uniref:HpcH/HpaI aldolase family protein n=1 Tax=Clostridium sp. AM58-1XD TaxID=2292307 RepID=UPI000E46F0CF|nr:aldolase/citrate lyase family protein [Clostridium sp. AM58-1XD]RGZ01200.1 2,4-dihydroxyhept-2-ene-1,7-dioic acid aldolase [Clostridium sp. AM58-1XD]
MEELKEKLERGEKIAGVMTRIVRNPAIALLAKNAGLDYIMMDCEHSNFTMETIHDILITANAVGLAGFVRVPEGTKAWISRVLDTGAAGVMVPMIETREQAENLVRYAKYQPIGGRGYTAGCCHTDYKGGKHADIMEMGNRKVIAIAQIETKKAVENAEEIASTEGIDALLIGPNDLSVSLGIPGDFQNPLELEAIKTVAAACRKYGKAFGLHAGGSLLEQFSDDLTLVMNSMDTDILAAGLKTVNDTCRNLGK